MGQRYREIRGRPGFFGGLWRLLFWGWQALMVVWFVSYTADVAPLIEGSTSEWEKVGAGLGVAISWGLILFFWVAGSTILSLFVLVTRPSRTMVLSEPPQQASAAVASRRNNQSQYVDSLNTQFKYWRHSLIIVTIAGVGLIIIYNKSQHGPISYGDAPLPEDAKAVKGVYNEGEQQRDAVSSLRRVGTPVVTPIPRTEPVPAASISQSEPIPVLSDSRARYFLLDLKKRSDGMVEVVSRREGPSGTSYARRLVDCPTGRALYLGEGDTLEAMEASKPETELWALCCGSISAYVAVFACDRAGSAAPHDILNYHGALPRSDRLVWRSGEGSSPTQIADFRARGNAWHVQEGTSPLDDSKNVAIWTRSIEPIENMFGQRVHPELALWCSEDRTRIYINWKIYIGIDSAEITYRVDKLPAETRSWQLSTNFEAIGLWSGLSAIPFIKHLFDRQTLLLRITPYGESPVTVTFNIEGLKDVAVPLMDACHWQSQAAARPKTTPEDRPSPAQENAEDAFGALLKSVEQLERRVEGETVQSGRGRSETAAGQARSVLGEAQLSFGEIDALKRQINRCWALPIGLEGIEDMVVQLRIQVRPDRTVQSVTIEDQSRLGRDPIFRAVAESARRAVDKCSPLTLPPGKYALWRDIVMNLYPADAISG